MPWNSVSCGYLFAVRWRRRENLGSNQIGYLGQTGSLFFKLRVCCVPVFLPPRTESISYPSATEDGTPWTDEMIRKGQRQRYNFRSAVL